MPVTVSYTVDSLKAVVSDFLRRADEAEKQAKVHPNSRHEARCEAEARTWRLAAAILDRTTVTSKPVEMGPVGDRDYTWEARGRGTLTDSD